jgi:hypothetical protein
MDVVKRDALAGSAEASGEIRAHFRCELWSSASNELGSRALAAIARRRIGTHGVANGLNDPTPGPPSAADSDTSTNADNVPKYAALRRSPWAACKIAG